jgi:hypothetical protein
MANATPSNPSMATLNLLDATSSTGPLLDRSDLSLKNESKARKQIQKSNIITSLRCIQKINTMNCDRLEYRSARKSTTGDATERSRSRQRRLQAMFTCHAEGKGDDTTKSYIYFGASIGLFGSLLPEAGNGPDLSVGDPAARGGKGRPSSARPLSSCPFEVEDSLAAEGRSTAPLPISPESESSGPWLRIPGRDAGPGETGQAAGFGTLSNPAQEPPRRSVPEPVRMDDRGDALPMTMGSASATSPSLDPHRPWKPWRC